MRWPGHVERMGEERKVYKLLVGKPEGKKPLGRPRHRWMGSEWILVRLAMGCRVYSIGSEYGSVAGPCEHGDEPPISGATDLVSQ
jgi:hypothetical protein